jgi:hypothetical protein
MSNVFFYIGLIIFSVIITLWTFLKNEKKWNALWFYFFTAGLAYMGEYFVLIVWDAYAYKPGMLPGAYRDNVVGHIISNFIALPSGAMLVTLFSLGYIWIFIITLLYTLIDYAFVRLDFYHHHWWKTYMTAITVFFYLAVTKYWYRLVQMKNLGWVRFITYFFIAFCLTTNSLFLQTVVFQKFRFQFGWVDHPIRDNTITYPLLAILTSILYVVAFCIVRTLKWRIVWLLLLPIIDVLLVSKDIIQFQKNWNLWKMLGFQLVNIFIFVALKKYSSERDVDNLKAP